MTDKMQKGKDAEDMAAEFLKSLGYEIVQRNYRYRTSEIDLIVFLWRSRCGRPMPLDTPKNLWITRKRRTSCTERNNTPMKMTTMEMCDTM